MCKKTDRQQRYYFSDKMKKQLAQISHYPLTIIEAPSGFGKTTAVREYLKEYLPEGACEYWYTSLGESDAMSWMGISQLFSYINNKVGDDLKNLKIPTMDTLYYVTTYLKDIHCQKETYLVIDNYQLVDFDISCELMNVFSMHGDPKLHIIFITQQLETKEHILIHNDNIHFIGISDFSFDREGISSLFRMKGIRLTDDEVERIYMSTEGWVAAIRLQIISFMETGSLTLTVDIEQLVEHVIWNHLDWEEQDFLLSVSVLDSFTIRQATIMINRDTLPNKIYELLRNNDFIRYLPDQFLYNIHSILLDYLRNRFYQHNCEDYRDQIYKRAGEACADGLQYCIAAEFYYKLGDFEGILSLPFTLAYFDNQKERYKSEFCATLINECPDEILCKYPFSMIIFGYMTLMNGHYDEYGKLCRLLYDVIENAVEHSQEQLRRIKGEYTLLKTLGEFNDIDKMIEGQNRYWALLGTSTDMIKASTAWLFGSVSVLSMFWRETGQLKNVLQRMEEGRLLYQKLTRGNGAGAYYTMQAEAMLMRGEDNEAEILCYRALHNARSYKQMDICLCIELILVRIAILRGDVEAYFNGIRRIQNYPNENSSLYILRMVEHCMSIISLLLGVKDYVSSWFYDVESIKKSVYAPVVPHARLLHLELLLMEKRYNEFYGACENGMNDLPNPTGNTKYAMPQIYQLIFLARAKRNNGKKQEAHEHLKDALNIALPDEIYLPFAQMRCMEDFLHELSMPFYGNARIPDVSSGEWLEDAPISLVAEYPEGEQVNSRENSFSILMNLCKRQKRGVIIIRKAILQDKSPLTPREREIALLARERLSAKEIGEKLYISHMTVRSTLRSVYRKLDIHSRGDLRLKEF